MALNDFETSTERGQPVELYQFIYGTGATSFYAYTNAEQAVDHDSINYTPLTITRDKLETEGKLKAKQTKIDVPLNSEVADLFRIFPPGRIVSVLIRQGHIPNPDDPGSFATGENFPVVWSGRVLESSRTGAVATLVCESISAGMKRPGLRKHYQWPCPLVLYGARCGATKTAIPSEVVSIAGNKLTFAAGWMGAQTPEKFIGGLVEWTTSDGDEARGILRVENDLTVVMTGPPTGLAPTSSVNVFIGCAHTLVSCEEDHNNPQNYGGHAWIPTVNPVNKNNHT